MKTRIIFISVFFLLTSGCASKKISWYMLSSNQHAKQKIQTDHEQISYVGMEKISLPVYLQTDNITTRVDDTKLHQEEFHRWAEPLADNISRVISLSVHNKLRNTEIAAEPWPYGMPIGLRLQVKILRFDSDLKCMSHLSATWTIFDKDQTKLLYRRTKEYVRKNQSTKIDDIVSSMSKNMNQLGDDIASSLARNIRTVEEK